MGTRISFSGGKVASSQSLKITTYLSSAEVNNIFASSYIFHDVMLRHSENFFLI